MTEHRAVVTWEGPGEPIMLTLYGPDGETAALPLLPGRALTLWRKNFSRAASKRPRRISGTPHRPPEQPMSAFALITSAYMRRLLSRWF